MKWMLVALGLMASPAHANGDVLSEYLWVARPLVVFAPSENDPRFKRQMELIEAGRADLDEREVIILTDTDPEADGPLRQRLHPRDFQLVLISKEGQIVLRKPFPWDVRELTRAIDKLPVRQQELRDRRLNPQ